MWLPQQTNNTILCILQPNFHVTNSDDIQNCSANSKKWRSLENAGHLNYNTKLEATRITRTVTKKMCTPTPLRLTGAPMPKNAVLRASSSEARTGGHEAPASKNFHGGRRRA